MTTVSQLPINYIITLLEENPDVQVFPILNDMVSRSVLVAETINRPLPVTVGGGAPGKPVGTQPTVDAQRKSPKGSNKL